MPSRTGTEREGFHEKGGHSLPGNPPGTVEVTVTLASGFSVVMGNKAPTGGLEREWEGKCTRGIRDCPCGS